jgi:hypothetical protein
MVIKAQSSTESKLHAFFIFSVDGVVYVQLQTPREQLTVTTGNILVGGGVSLPQSHTSLLHLKLQLL